MIGRFLGGLELDRLGLFYSSAAQQIDAGLIDAPDPVAFPAGLSVAARLGSGGNFTDFMLPPPASAEDPATPLPENAVAKPGPPATDPPAKDTPLRMW